MVPITLSEITGLSCLMSLGGKVKSLCLTTPILKASIMGLCNYNITKNLDVQTRRKVLFITTVRFVPVRKERIWSIGCIFAPLAFHKASIYMNFPRGRSFLLLFTMPFLVCVSFSRVALLLLMGNSSQTTLLCCRYITPQHIAQ